MAEAQGCPAPPQKWYCPIWGYPEAWEANVKRTYDVFGPIGTEIAGRGWDLRDLRAKLTEDLRDSKDERDSDIRGQKTTLQDSRLKLESMLWAAYLESKEAYRTAQLQIVYDNLSDARVQRALMYNLQAVKMSEMEAVKEAMEMAEVSLKELLGTRHWGAVYPPPAPAPRVE